MPDTDTAAVRCRTDDTPVRVYNRYVRAVLFRDVQGLRVVGKESPWEVRSAGPSGRELCRFAFISETVYGRYCETDAVEGAEFPVDGKAARIHIHGDKVPCGSDVHGRGP